MSDDALDKAIAAVPPGAWAVGVSGGADSVALLALLRRRADVRCHAVHLDHETRGGASAADARFVAELCAAWHVDHTITPRSELEPLARDLPANRSARFRALRLMLFRTACARHGLAGVILAHHADDQAETIVQRLLRGSGPAGPAGLAGMASESVVGGLRIQRPLLGVTSRQLRELLVARGQGWREDASNASAAYQRNRVRAVLARHARIAEAARGMGGAMGELAAWARGCAPRLGDSFAVRELADWPDALAAEAARRWLAERGAPRDELSPAVAERLVAMARDAGTAARRHFPGGVLVGRRGGRIGVIGTRRGGSVAGGGNES